MPSLDIQLGQLTIGYRAGRRTHIVARDISATIVAGQLTCLLGPNGAGKSTLLRTLAGFQPMLGGTVAIGPHPLHELAPRQLARLVSVVLTERSVPRGLTVADLVALGRSPYTGFWGTLGPDDRAIVSQAIADVGLTHLAQRHVDTLSDGERQKAMIAKALAQQTPAILLDEPTAFLDYASKVDTMRLLHRLSRTARKTILLSTHDLDLALQAADRLWLMTPGDQPLTIGTPEDLALDGSLQRFLQAPGVGFDTAAGLPRMEFQCNSQACLTGHGQRLDMMRKALLRNAIQPTDDPTAPLAIHVDDFTISISRNGQPDITAETIGQAVEEIIEKVKD